eukprot:scaffold2091_cov122-Isochrysis_galbana.AAC.1
MCGVGGATTAGARKCADALSSFTRSSDTRLFFLRTLPVRPPPCPHTLHGSPRVVLWEPQATHHQTNAHAVILFPFPSKHSGACGDSTTYDARRRGGLRPESAACAHIGSVLALGYRVAAWPSAAHEFRLASSCAIRSRTAGKAPAAALHNGVTTKSKKPT